MNSTSKIDRLTAIERCVSDQRSEMSVNADNRFQRYKIGEHCALAAMRCGVIRAGQVFGWGPQVTADRQTDPSAYWDQVAAQRINGDLFMTDQDGRITFVDVKNKAWISEQSLNEFRPDGLFFIDAWYRPSSEDFARGGRTAWPALIRATEEFRQMCRDQFKRTQRQANGHWGYEITVSQLRPEWLLDDFDPTAYTRFMREVWDLYYAD